MINFLENRFFFFSLSHEPIQHKSWYTCSLDVANHELYFFQLKLKMAALCPKKCMQKGPTSFNHKSAAKWPRALKLRMLLCIGLASIRMSECSQKIVETTSWLMQPNAFCKNKKKEHKSSYRLGSVCLGGRGLFLGLTRSKQLANY